MRLSRFLRDDTGQSAVLTAVCLACLCGIIGLGLDSGTLYRNRRILQAAADAAAVAGAAELAFGNATSAAKAASAQNGATDGVDGVTVTVNTPPSSGARAGYAGYVEAIVSRSVPNTFMRILGIGTTQVSARSVAGYGPSAACVFTLSASSTDVSISGTGSLSLPNCGLLVDSTSSRAVSLSGTASINARSIGIVGSYSVSGSGTLSPTPVDGIAPVSDPLSFEKPPSYNSSACLADPKVTSTATLGPSTSGGTICYKSISISGSSRVTFNPGTYVILGSFSVSGSATLTGSGVTFYLAPPSGSVSLSGSATLTLTAPTSGTYNGLLFYEDPADTNTMSVSGSGASVLTGIFYAPSAGLSITGSSGAVFNTDLVCNNLTISGTGSLNEYMSASGSPLAAARLVE